jgi:anaerobic selenocysteine-containing dehydrogenase
MKNLHYRACTMCEAMCGIAVESEGRQVLSIRGDDADPFSRGHICPKAMALADVHHDPDRLRTPLLRQGERFVPIGWEQAFDEVAANLKRVQREHGKNAVAMYYGNPSAHNSGIMLSSPVFASTLHTKSMFSASSVDQLPHMLAAYLMFGHQLLLPVPDIDRTDYMLMLGANPAVSNGSAMSAPGAANRLKDIIGRGGKLVVLDPRRSETAALASEHHAIRPGSDALFLLALLHVLVAEQRVNFGALAPLVDGAEQLATLVAGFSPERVAARTGVPAETITRLAREFAAAPRAVCYGRFGVCTQDFGTLACWLIYVINLATGNLDREGGAMFTEPAIDVLALGGKAACGQFGTFHSRLRKLPEFNGELPVAVLAEEIETPGEGQIRALVTTAGNPVLSTPNGTRLERALSTLDFMVSVDFYLNETTRHAHVILPPSGPLEHDHYDFVFHMVSVRNTAKYSPAGFAREPDARHDYEIFNALAVRMSETFSERAVARSYALLLETLGPARVIDWLLRSGPYGDRFLPWRRGLSLRALQRAPHGVDLGPLRPCLAKRMPAHHARIVLAPEPLRQDVARLERQLEAPRAGELVLIGRRQLRSHNSWLHNSPRLIKGPARCTLQMHPSDAAARGLGHGSQVLLSSKVGAIQVPLEITDALMPGVVSLPHGFGHTRAGTGQRTASAHPGASINDVTDEARIDPLSGNASFSGLPVTVGPVPHLRDATTG